MFEQFPVNRHLPLSNPNKTSLVCYFKPADDEELIKYINIITLPVHYVGEPRSSEPLLEHTV